MSDYKILLKLYLKIDSKKTEWLVQVKYDKIYIKINLKEIWLNRRYCKNVLKRNKFTINRKRKRYAGRYFRKFAKGNI